MPERDERGRFLPGNKGGPGNPLAARVHEHRQAVIEAVSPEEVQAVFRVLLDKALEGDTMAAKVLLDRLFGRAGVFEDDAAPVQFQTILIPIHGPDDPIGKPLPPDEEDWEDELL